MTFAVQTYHRLEQLFGGSLQDLPNTAQSIITGDGHLSWTMLRPHIEYPMMQIALSRDAGDQDDVAVTLALDHPTRQGFALFWRHHPSRAALVRMEDPLAGAALDRMTCNWLVRRVSAGHLLRMPMESFVAAA